MKFLKSRILKDRMIKNVKFYESKLPYVKKKVRWVLHPHTCQTLEIQIQVNNSNLTLQKQHKILLNLLKINLNLMLTYISNLFNVTTQLLRFKQGIRQLLIQAQFLLPSISQITQKSLKDNDFSQMIKPIFKKSLWMSIQKIV